MMQVNEVVRRQFSLEALWGRIARVGTVAATWIGANGVPATGQTWGLFAAAVLGASYSHGPAPKK